MDWNLPLDSHSPRAEAGTALSCWNKSTKLTRDPELNSSSALQIAERSAHAAPTAAPPVQNWYSCVQPTVTPRLPSVLPVKRTKWNFRSRSRW